MEVSNEKGMIPLVKKSTPAPKPVSKPASNDAIARAQKAASSSSKTKLSKPGY